MSDSAVYSVYTPTSPAAGKVKSEAKLTRGPEPENDKKWTRGVAQAGQSLTVIGACASKYRVKMPEGFRFSDGSDDNPAVYVDKSKVSIPVSDVNLNGSIWRVYEGDSFRVSATVLPGMADDQGVTWSSSKPGVARVDRDGTVTGVRYGKATVTAAAGNKSAVCKVTVVKSADTANRKGTDSSGVFGSFPWVSSISKSSVKVGWHDMFAENKAYVLYKKKAWKKGARWEKVATKVAGTAAKRTYKFKGLKSGKRYGFKVESRVLSGTKNTECYATTIKIDSKTKKANKKYFVSSRKVGKKNRVVKKQGGLYDGVLVTKKPASSKKMESLSVTMLGAKCRPCVKYNFSTKKQTLYIHLFVNYSGQGAPQKFTDRAGKADSRTYRKLYEAGVKRALTTYVVGSKKNFGSSKVRFRTTVVFHRRYDRDNAEKMQKYIGVQIGAVSKGARKHECSEWRSGYHWFHAYSAGYDTPSGTYEYWLSSYGQPEIYLPTNAQLAAEAGAGPGAVASAEHWASTCAHETGHAMGLDDAYDLRKAYDRLTTGDETSVKVSSYTATSWQNIMTSCTYLQTFFANDFEMMLAGYAHAARGEKIRSWQSYKQHVDAGRTHYKSDVIW